MRAIAILFGLALGCAVASQRSDAQWQGYCCDEASSDARRGCRPIAPEDASSCRADARVPIECRSVRECSGDATRCFCCRLAPGAECVVAVRSARGRPIVDVSEPPPPVPHRPAPTIWSPF